MDENYAGGMFAKDTLAEDGSTPETLAQRVDALLDRWFFEAFAGSRIAQSTETWNCVHVAFQDLKRQLAPLLDPSPAL